MDKKKKGGIVFSSKGLCEQRKELGKTGTFTLVTDEVL